MNLEDLKEIDKFDKFKSYIKNFILADESQTLLKLIYYSNSSPLTQPDLENPYEIFTENSNGKHGVVIFGEKNNEILNSEITTVLVSLSSETSEDSDCITTVFTEFNIILKGQNIQELSDGSNRGCKISELIDEQYNHKEITDVGQIKKVSFDNLIVNEENCGYTLKYKCVVSKYNDIVKVYTHNETVDEWGITRQSYSLCTTITNPIIYPIENLYSQLSDGSYESLVTESNAETLVDVKPYSLDKSKKDYGYDVTIKRRLVCNIVPEINESTIIGYEDKYYRVEKFITYEDYMDCTLIVTYNAIINE